MKLKPAVVGFKAFATSLALIALTGSAFGQSAFKRDVDACFTRAYSKQHMKKHPQQTVTYIQVKHNVAENNKLIEGYSGSTTAISETLIDVSVRFKGDAQTYSNALVCFGDSSFCGVECDGGRAAFTLKANGELLVDVRKTNGFVVEGGCDNEEGSKTRYVGDASDDKLFKLFPADMALCSTPNS